MQPAFRPIPQPRFEFSFLILGVLAAFVILAGIQIRNEWNDAQRGLLIFERTQADAMIDAGLIRAARTVTARPALSSALARQTVMVQARTRHHAYIGAGVIVAAKHGMLDILTARHVIDHPGVIEIQFENGTLARATILRASVNDDLAILRVAEPSRTRYAVATLAEADLRSGEAFVVLGHPGNRDWAATPGIAEAHIHTTLLFCPACDRGDSGAGAFDMHGLLHGIVVKKLTILSPGAKKHDAIVAFTTVRPDRIRAFLR